MTTKTNGEVIESVQIAYSKGIPSDDSRFSSRYIYNELLKKRNTLLIQKANKKQMINTWVYQSICMELEQVALAQCPCVIEKGTKVMKSKHELPQILSSLDKLLISSVTSVDGSINFGATTWQTRKHKIGSKFTGKNPDYFIHNNYLYITNEKMLSLIYLTAIFEDPIKAVEFNNLCSECKSQINDCTDYNDYPFLLDDKLDTCVDMTVDRLLDITRKTTEDKTNNASDDVQTVNNAG